MPTVRNIGRGLSISGSASETHIPISTERRELLRNIKYYEIEPFDSVIRRLCHSYEGDE